MLGNDYPGQNCALARTLEVVGERWTLLILRDAFFGVSRFTDFADHLDVPRAVLADRLRTLVDDGLLRRDDDGYALTENGVALWPVLHAMVVWGRRYQDRPGRDFRHAACDTPLDDRGACPSCETLPGPSDVLAVPAPEPAGRTDRVSRALREPHRLTTALRRDRSPRRRAPGAEGSARG